VNVDGQVNVDDLREVLARLGSRLPSGQPAGAVDPLAMVAVDAVFNRAGAAAAAAVVTTRQTRARPRNRIDRLQSTTIDLAMAEQSTPDRVRIIRRRAGSGARR
jgi:hypothetical protein